MSFSLLTGKGLDFLKMFEKQHLCGILCQKSGQKHVPLPPSHSAPDLSAVDRSVYKLLIIIIHGIP